MPGQGGVVGEDDAAPHLAVVGDVGVGHEQAVAPHPGERRRPWPCRGGRCRTRGTRLRSPISSRTSSPWNLRSWGSKPMAALGWIRFSRPIRVGPWIWAPAPISVPSPISTPAPMTANGPTVTPSPSRGARIDRPPAGGSPAAMLSGLTIAEESTASAASWPSTSHLARQLAEGAAQPQHLDLVADLVAGHHRAAELRRLDAGEVDAACSGGRARRPAAAGRRPAPSPRSAAPRAPRAGPGSGRGRTAR